MNSPLSKGWSIELYVNFPPVLDGQVTFALSESDLGRDIIEFMDGGFFGF